MLLLQLLQGLSKGLVVLTSFLTVLAAILQHLLACLSPIDEKLVHSLQSHKLFKLLPVPQVASTLIIGFIVDCIVIAIRYPKAALRLLEKLLIGELLPDILFSEVLLSDIKILLGGTLLHDDT